MTNETRDTLHHLIDKAANPDNAVEVRRKAMMQAVMILHGCAGVIDGVAEVERSAVERIKRAYGADT
jgi:hypothetical protein